MSGTKLGGIRAAETNRDKYGAGFYAEIGRKGGRKGRTGGFAANPELARIAGAKGGRRSRRGPIRLGDYNIIDESTGEIIGTVYTSSEIKAIKMAKSKFYLKLTHNSVIRAELKK